MGIRPRGLGLRLKSLQLHPAYVPGVGGERCPLTDFSGAAALMAPFVSGAEGTGVCPFAFVDFVAFFDVNFVNLRVSMGLRLRVRARRSSGLSSSSSSSTGAGVAIRFRAADLVTGPKYDSRSSISEGVGLGEMTRGVAGMEFPLMDML